MMHAAPNDDLYHVGNLVYVARHKKAMKLRWVGLKQPTEPEPEGKPTLYRSSYYTYI